VKETQITKLLYQAQMSSLKQPVLRNEGEIFWWKIRRRSWSGLKLGTLGNTLTASLRSKQVVF